MARVIKRTTPIRDDREVIYEDTTVDETVDSPGNVLARIVNVLLSLLLVLLAIRFILVLFGANRLNSFADFIYSASHPFVSPFFGLFNYQTNYGQGRFEYETLVAMAVYAVIGWAVIRIISTADRNVE